MLQGSGALYFCYNSPRKPKDLDFISPNLLDHKFKIGEKLSHKFQNIVGVGFNIEEGPDYIDIEYKNLGKIQICEQNITDFHEINNIQVSSEVELTTDKIVTLHHRIKKHNKIKETDIKDIEFLLNRGVTVSLDQIESKARQYNYRAWDKETNTKLIQYLKTGKYEIKEYTIELLKSCSECMVE